MTINIDGGQSTNEFYKKCVQCASVSAPLFSKSKQKKNNGATSTILKKRKNL